ncbi:hypothetical protein GF360_03515 [candidate division WWE3 bacterium]|nr:hypothetical protein [candidate division WWE3 bacterium]
MTEIYFLFFMTLSFYYMEKFHQQSNLKNLLTLNLFIFISYMARQVGLILSVAFLISPLLKLAPKIKKNYKFLLSQFLLTFFLIIFHLFIFPQTEQMQVTQFSLTPLKDPIYTFSIIAVVLIYLTAFFLPVLPASLFKKQLIKSKVFWVLTIAFAVLSLWFFRNHFDPLHIVFTYLNRNGNLVFFGAAGEFPYFKNIFGREGFFVDDLAGSKYSFRGFFDLFKYWNLLATIAVPFLLALIFSKKKHFTNFYLIYAVLYGGALLVFPKIYDRYLLYMFPAILLLLAPLLSQNRRVLLLTFLPFLAFLFFLDYQYSLDFLQVQNYVWKKSEELVLVEGVSSSDIKSGNSWQALYPREEGKDANDWRYYFAYDMDNRCCFQVVEEKEFDFPFSLFIQPKLRLYKRVE